MPTLPFDFTSALGLGREATELTFAQISLRSIIVFLAALVMLHRALAYAARRSHPFGDLIKGRSDVVIRDGTLDEALAMRNLLSKHDVMEDLRLHGNVDDIADVSLAVFERNGHISVVRRTKREAPS